MSRGYPNLDSTLHCVQRLVPKPIPDLVKLTVNISHYNYTQNLYTESSYRVNLGKSVQYGYEVCTSYFSNAGIKCHDKVYAQKEKLGDYSCRRVRAHHRKGDHARHGGGTAKCTHPHLQATKKKSALKWHMAFETSKSYPRDSLPPSEP